MNTIEIKTQAEFDKLPDKFEIYTQINIIGQISTINNAPKNSHINVSGSATIKFVYGSATIKSVSGSATIEYVSMNAIIRILSNDVNIITARQQVVLIFQDCKPAIRGECDSSVIINKITKAEFNIENFIGIYDIEKQKNNLILYKFVKTDFTDFYRGRIEYKLGTIVKCPDWISDNKHECGGGLHLGATPKWAKYFNNNNEGRLLKCEVAIKDIVVHPNPQYPFKIRCKKLKVLEEIK
jgi:hypothetical protein